MNILSPVNDINACDCGCCDHLAMAVPEFKQPRMPGVYKLEGTDRDTGKRVLVAAVMEVGTSGWYYVRTHMGTDGPYNSFERARAAMIHWAKVYYGYK